MDGSLQGHRVFVTHTYHLVYPQTLTLKSFLLSTEHFPENHTAERLSKDLMAVIEKRSLKDPIIVTDNARNMTNSCDIARLPHFGCSAHTLNLAVN